MGGNLGRRAPKKLGFSHLHIKEKSKNVIENYVRPNFEVFDALYDL